MVGFQSTHQRQQHFLKLPDISRRPGFCVWVSASTKSVINSDWFLKKRPRRIIYQADVERGGKMEINYGSAKAPRDREGLPIAEGVNEGIRGLALKTHFTRLSLLLISMVHRAYRSLAHRPCVTLKWDVRNSQLLRALKYEIYGSGGFVAKEAWVPSTLHECEDRNRMDVFQPNYMTSCRTSTKGSTRIYYDQSINVVFGKV
ncbi:hypothetical protein TNIN_144371 [Trichonephila inaurata madagascariensis]|uniref:Uncharacterized protein n=1 Tax=Trichonephila inaurata madagascariensis TaxID=2747483 RepID=A0A8X6JL41_9ARAC|nr:hypothetical protein TNIN_144371 [Trichonephila inaurata madagascariensis]